MCSDVPGGPHGRVRAAAASTVGGGHVLELERHDVDVAGEGAHGVEVVVRGDDLDVGDLAGRACRRRARGCGRDSPCGARRSRTCARAGRCRARRSSRPAGSDSCRSRQRVLRAPAVLLGAERRSCSRSSGRALARMATASRRRIGRAGLADGQRRRPARRPASARSTAANRGPCSAWLWTGTPSTGSIVCAATMPGRCAAPPAPAMITSRPRASASRAYSAIQSGVRCAETTRHSCGTPNASAPRRRAASSPSPTCCP